MHVMHAAAARLDQSVRMAANLGTELPAANLSSEHQVRNAIWRCIFCRHGAECREWLGAGKAGVPEFCRNREFYLGHARDAA